MPKSGNETRQRIMQVARDLALKQGHVSTSIDEIIDKTGITKGSFFYHFPNKQALSHALIEEFSSSEIEILETTLEKCRKLSKDPLQQLLIFVGLIQQIHAEMETDHFGCLFASYSYQNQLEDKDIKAMVTETLAQWKKELSKLIKQIIQVHPPRSKANPDDLADMFLATLEGAYVLTRIMHDPNIVQLNLEQYKTYIETLFSPN